MKKYFSILFLALSFLASATPTVLFTVAHDVTVTPTTVKPSNFPDGGVPNLTEAIYSQESGTARKFTLANTQKAIGLKAATSTIAYVPTATGNPISDRNKIVKCSVNSKTYLIDILGNAIENGASGSTQIAQTLSLNSTGTLKYTNPNAASTFVLLPDSSATNEIQVLSDATVSSAPYHTIQLSKGGGQFTIPKSVNILNNSISKYTIGGTLLQDFNFSNQSWLNLNSLNIESKDLFLGKGTGIVALNPTGTSTATVGDVWRLTDAATGAGHYASLPTASTQNIETTLANGNVATTHLLYQTSSANVELEEEGLFLDAAPKHSDLTAERLYFSEASGKDLIFNESIGNNIFKYTEPNGTDLRFRQSQATTPYTANITLPNADGILAKSVNGILADVSGNITLPASQNLTAGSGVAITSGIISNTSPNVTETATQTPFTAIAAITTQTAVTGANVQEALSSVATSLKNLESNSVVQIPIAFSSNGGTIGLSSVAYYPGYYVKIGNLTTIYFSLEITATQNKSSFEFGIQNHAPSISNNLNLCSAISATAISVSGIVNSRTGNVIYDSNIGKFRLQISEPTFNTLNTIFKVSGFFSYIEQ